MAATYTCITCCVAFKNPDIQRLHYKTDWHRYNLKRKVAELSPVTAEDFEQKVLNQRAIDAENSSNKSVYCTICKKHFSTTKSYENHIKSNKHKERLKNEICDNNIKKEIVRQQPKVSKDNKMNFVNTAGDNNDNDSIESDIETDSEIEELSSDEWNEEDFDNPINKNICLFCKNQSESLVANIKHMSETHSFFLPDLEYCVDLKGLLLHLGAKVFYEHICLWCNGKIFNSVQAVQKHMVMKFFFFLNFQNMLHD